MDHSFWHAKWRNNEIGFHGSAPNPLLVQHLPALHLKPNSRLFLPLCGKTLDIHYLLAQGYRVSGAELSPLAIKQLFEELGIQPTITPAGKLQHYQAPNLDLFVGDIFDLTPELLGPVDAVYDRAALMALPAEVRRRYAAHLLRLTHNAPQLLICCHYDQSLMNGPPFSIAADEVRRLYAPTLAPQLLASEEIANGLKGRFPATDTVYLLTP